MGSECIQIKRHYDLSMSKRTRKPTKVDDSKDTRRSSSSKGGDLKEDTTNPRSLKKSMKHVEGANGQRIAVVGSLQSEDVIDHKSLKLKELMLSVEEDQKNGKNSLGHHFREEEKQLQLVTKKKGDCDGVKMRGIVSRYVRVLSHLIRIKASSKKPILRLTM